MLAIHSSAVKLLQGFRLVAVGALCASAASNLADAAPINWGDRVGQDVTYRMIIEDSGTDTVPPP